PPHGRPELPHGPLVADDHARAGVGRGPGEGRAAVAGGDEVDADVAERVEAAVAALDRVEAPEPAPRDVLEEHPLDGLARAELEHLLVGRLREAHDRRILASRRRGPK